MRKIIAAICCFVFLFVTISSVIVFAEPQTTIEIIITQNGQVVDRVHRGDVFRVTVNLLNFPNLLTAHPSLHFNPNVVRVSDSEGNILPSSYGSRIFNTNMPVTDTNTPELATFHMGNALATNNWGGSFDVGTHFPFLRNETGVIGMQVARSHGRDLTGRQTIFSVYFVAIAGGNPDIRMSSHTDGEGREPNQSDWFDHWLYHDGANYVMYNWVQDPNNPTVVTWDNHSFFIIPQLFADAEIMVLNTANDEVITSTFGLQGGEQVYATLDRTDIGNDAKLILAVYDNGKFYAINVSKGDRTENITLPNNISETTIKVFVWCGSGGMEPRLKPLIIGG